MGCKSMVITFFKVGKRFKNVTTFLALLFRSISPKLLFRGMVGIGHNILLTRSHNIPEFN